MIKHKESTNYGTPLVFENSYENRTLSSWFILGG